MGDRKMDERTINETPIDDVVVMESGKKNVILDATLLSSLMACPRLTDFRFNLNFTSVDGKSNSLECGSIVHVYMEYFNKALIAGMKRDDAFGFGITAAELYIKGCPNCTDFVPHNVYDDDIPKLLKKPKCGHKINEFPGVKNTPQEPDRNNPRDRYKMGWSWVLDTCDQYHRFWRNDHWIPLEAEVVKGEILYEDDEVRVLWKAKLDLIADTNQGIYPIDHKTMKQNREGTTMNNQFIGQCHMMKTRGMFINKIGFQATLKPEERFTRKMMNYSESRLLEWQSSILPYYAKLLMMYSETGYFPPNLTHCESKYGNCAFVKVCEADTTMREETIKQLFIVGPDWNPTNEEVED